MQVEYPLASALLPYIHETRPYQASLSIPALSSHLVWHRLGCCCSCLGPSAGMKDWKTYKVARETISIPTNVYASGVVLTVDESCNSPRELIIETESS